MILWARRVFLFTLVVGFFIFKADAAESSLAAGAAQILKTHCNRCHGQDGNAKGGLNFILDPDKLVARNKIVPGSPAESRLFRRVAQGEMPPENSKSRPSAEEVAYLKKWIEAGAPGVLPAEGKREFITDAEMVRIIWTDLQTVAPRHRRYQRYFTLMNLYNAGVRESDLQVYRHGLAKLLNSLSWHPRISVPWPLDSAKTIYRIDLRDFQWNASAWSRTLSSYPYLLPQKSAEAIALAAATGTEMAYIRADWFTATASRPPLYHDLLQIPLTDRDLERQLRVDWALNLQEERAVRSGFNGSGVSKNNRLLERHDAAHGAYWRSYDFSDNVDRQNLFEHPLGPLPGQNSFEHAGGEVIFNLPNGLQGYMLVDANGRRLDRAPVEIVSDVKRPDKVVETAVSCFSCHVQGLMHKADQVRAHVEKNPNAFTKADRETVQALYPAEAKFKALLEEDVARYQKAVAKTGAPVTELDPINALAQRFEGELDQLAAAAEVGIKPEEFAKRLAASEALPRFLGPLNVKGGTVQRQVFQKAFPDLVREFKLGEVAQFLGGTDTITLPLPVDAKPFAGHTGLILCVAFSPDGRRMVTGSEDTTLRLWEVATGREVRPLEGHTQEVLSVAFSPDGKQIVSGSTDRTVRLWEVTSGRQLRLFEGHTERVSGVAFSPDGKRILSGSWDQAISLWDVETGKEIKRLGGHGGYVSSVAFSPDGKQALSGSYDKTTRLWDLDMGKEVRRFEGHAKEVYCVAFSPDGKRILSGGNDQTVRMWEADTAKELIRLEGHGRAVTRVAFSPDGSRLLTGGSSYSSNQGGERAIRIWKTDSGQEVGSLGGKRDSVWCLAFSADGRWAAAGTSDKWLRLWEIPR